MEQCTPRDVTPKVSKREQPVLYKTSNLNFIFIAKLFQAISSDNLVMMCTRLTSKSYQRAVTPGKKQLRLTIGIYKVSA